MKHTSVTQNLCDAGLSAARKAIQDPGSFFLMEALSAASVTSMVQRRLQHDSPLLSLALNTLLAAWISRIFMAFTQIENSQRLTCAGGH